MEDNFITNIIDKDLKEGKYKEIVTRFPPEPNGYLHIGSAKAININYTMAKRYGGHFNLRFDDTNPSKEETEYVDSIMEDISWLGCNWDNLFFGSDYFDKMYEYAVYLIKKGLAYVCELSPDEIREYRGTLTEPGKESPYRNRSIEENLNLFDRMRNSEFDEGEMVLRVKIDMSSPNLNMRDPIMYRIQKKSHYHTGDKWCIYPMYDWAHGIEDAEEGISHSLCSLEFENHKPLYNWFLHALEIKEPPTQIEFSKLFLTYTVLGKRKLIQMVKEGYVNGWDDPRMPTLCGLRRRGYTPESIRNFLNNAGVSKGNSIVDITMLEHFLREDLNQRSMRVMAVLNPLKVIIDNFPDDHVEWLDAVNNPEDPQMGSRKIPFTKEIYIEKQDFLIDPPKKFFRLAPGKEVRLMHGYYIKCESYNVDEKTGEVLEVHCTYDEQTKGGWSKDGRKVKGTLHWVSASHATKAEIRLYDRLFTKENPEEKEEGKSFLDFINTKSIEILENCFVEPSLLDAELDDRYQFLRIGYFTLDKDASKDKLIFNRTVSLRDSWKK